MAEDKQSFIAYTDWKEIFDNLPDEIAGKLIKHVFAYVNDENPKSDDFIINAVFSPIKASLKRDLKKWEKSVKEKQDAGYLGNLKRWNKDIYDDYMSKKITLEEAKIIAESRKVSQTDDLRPSAIAPVSHRVAKIAVSDSVSVSVSVSDNVNNKEGKKEKENSEKKSSIPSTDDLENIFPDQIVKVETAIKLLKSERWISWRELHCKNNSWTIDQMFDFMDKFLIHLKEQNQFEKSAKDTQNHFLSWIKKGLHLDKETKASDPVLDDENEKPAGPGDWIFFNGKWRDKKLMTSAQIKRLKL